MTKFEHNKGMTIEEIKSVLSDRNMTQQQLAEELGISYSSIRQILSGATKLTAQLSRHIEYVLGKRKQQTFIYTVDLPEGTVQSWLPQHANMSEEEKRQALTAICERIKRDLIAAGERALPSEEREQLKAPTPSQDIGRKKQYTAVFSDLATAPPTPTTQEAATYSPTRHSKLAELEKKKHKRTVRFKAGRTTTKEDNIRAQDFFPTEKN